MATNHNPGQLICIFINLLSLIALTLVVISALSFEYDYSSLIPKLFQRGLSEVDSTFPTPISLHDWLHTSWLVVIAWQLAWSLHGILTICRTFAGVPVYVSPQLQSVPLLLFSAMANSMSMAWFVCYDREYVTTSVLVSFCVTGLVWISFIFSLHNLQRGVYRLKKGERFKDIWLHRFLVENGLALFGSWTYLVTTFNLATTLIYNDKITLDKDWAAVISLSALGTQMVIYLVLDVVAVDRWTRYVFTPYVINIVVLGSSLIRSEPWESDRLVFVLLAGLMTFALAAIMVKSACVAWRVMRPSSSGGGEISGDPMMPFPMGEAHYLLKQ